MEDASVRSKWEQVKADEGGQWRDPLEGDLEKDSFVIGVRIGHEGLFFFFFLFFFNRGTKGCCRILDVLEHYVEIWLLDCKKRKRSGGRRDREVGGGGEGRHDDHGRGLNGDLAFNVYLHGSSPLTRKSSGKYPVGRIPCQNDLHKFDKPI